jgi:hypothetical protein
MKPLCWNSQLPYRNGWQFDCSTGVPVAARTLSEEQRRADVTGDVDQVAVAPRRQGVAIEARAISVPVLVVPTQPEAVGVRKAAGEAVVAALLDKPVLRVVQQRARTNRVAVVRDPATHFASRHPGGPGGRAGIDSRNECLSIARSSRVPRATDKRCLGYARPERIQRDRTHRRHARRDHRPASVRQAQPRRLSAEALQAEAPEVARAIVRDMLSNGVTRALLRTSAK